MTEPRDPTPPPARPGASTLEETRPLTTEEWGGGPGDTPPDGPGGGGGGGSDDGTGSSSNGGSAGSDKRTGSHSRAAIEWGILIVAALVIAIVIRTFVFQAFYIPSESMVPTLKVGDRVLVNKLSYKLHDPRRGDIIVFKAPEGAATAEIKDLVKRLVGLPGETIEGRDGKIYINGRELEEPYLPTGVKSRTFGPEKVPPDSLLHARRQPAVLEGLHVLRADRAQGSDRPRVHAHLATQPSRLLVTAGAAAPATSAGVGVADGPLRHRRDHAVDAVAVDAVDALTERGRGCSASPARPRRTSCSPKRCSSVTSPFVHSEWCRFRQSTPCAARSAAWRSIAVGATRLRPGE